MLIGAQVCVRGESFVNWTRQPTSLGSSRQVKAPELADTNPLPQLLSPPLIGFPVASRDMSFIKENDPQVAVRTGQPTFPVNLDRIYFRIAIIIGLKGRLERNIEFAVVVI